MERIKVFTSYAHDDDAYFKDFTSRFKKAVKNSQNFDWHLWDDRDIHVGTFWDDAIQKNIQDCNIALLLVSMSFMSSSYIKEQEFEKFKKLYEEKGILIAPILFAPCDFQRWEDLSKIQFFMPSGAEYGKATVENFTYADLVNFKADGTVLPNPNADRYVLDLVRRIETAFKAFLEQRKEIEEDIIIEIPITENINKLSEAPRSRSYFTGRDKEIKDFKDAIDDGVTLIAIDGPGGIGKTQFISKCIEKYITADKIIWYSCTAASHVDTLISQAGYPELLKGDSKTDREKFSAFKTEIEKNGSFLFLDNFQETNNNPVFREFLVFIQDYLKRGCVVVIDRDDLRSVDLTPRRIHIEGFKENQLEYAKTLIDHSYKGDVIISDTELGALCKQLHGYPLIIDLAILLLSQGETPENIITKIAQDGDNEKVSERLLNAIFSRPDASPAEQNFITQFSVFTGKVSENDIKAIISDALIIDARKKLQQKNLLSLDQGYYEIHPLVRELCYKKIEDTESLHARVADHFIKQRIDILDPALEEQIFYHLLQSRQWERIDREIEENGRKYILQGQLGLVKELLDRLIKIGVNKPIFSILSGDIAQIQGQWAEAQEHFNKAKNNDVNKRIKIEGIIRYADIAFLKGFVMEALHMQIEAYDLCENIFLKEKASAANSIGTIYESMGDSNLAMKYYDESFALASEINDKEAKATCLFGLGNIYLNKEDYDESLKNLKASLAIFTDINDKLGVANSMHSIGHVFLNKGKYDSAIKNYEESLSFCESIGNRSNIASALVSIGNVHRRLNKFDLAIKKYEEAKIISEEIGNKDTLATILYNTALVFRQQNKFDDVIELYEKCIVIRKEIHDIPGIAYAYVNLGEIYARNSPKNYGFAIHYFLMSVALFNKIHIKSQYTFGLKCLVIIRDDLGLPKFKDLVMSTLEKIDTDLKQFIPINELLKQPIVTVEPKVGRNDPCPCGNGKKYKQCHGKNAA